MHSLKAWLWSQCRLQLAFSLSPLWSVLHGATNYLFRTWLWWRYASLSPPAIAVIPYRMALWWRGTESPSQTASLLSFQLLLLLFPFPIQSTGCAPHPLLPFPSHRPLAIARMFRAPSQLHFAAHVDFCPSLQARKHFSLITIVFHIVIYGSFSALC